MSVTTRKAQQENPLFDSIELDSQSDKSLSVFIIRANDLESFEDVKTRDFSDLETFYNAIREAKIKIYNEGNKL